MIVMKILAFIIHIFVQLHKRHGKNLGSNPWRTAIKMIKYRGALTNVASLQDSKKGPMDIEKPDRDDTLIERRGLDLRVKISSQLAESLVEKTMSILGKNINIMDHQGMIIASGDRKRINSFHEGAVHVIQQREIIEISCDESQHLM